MTVRVCVIDMYWCGPDVLSVSSCRCLTEYTSYGEAIPRYQAGLEKNTVLSVCNPKERLHVKWRQTMARRKERDGKLKARHINKELSKVISASVQACDRYASLILHTTCDIDKCTLLVMPAGWRSTMF